MTRWIVLAGATAWAVIAYFATSENQSHNDGLGRRNVYSIAMTLQQKAEAALTKLGAQQWAGVTVEGQTAVLSGEAPTESDRQDAVEAVRSAEWPGGKWIGGITGVRDKMTVAKPVSPYEWTAQLGERGRVRLAGHVPGQKHRRAIHAEAQRLFPQGVEDQMVIAQGAPTGPWADTAIWALAQLSRLSSGEARFKDKVLLIRGTAPNAAVQTDIEAAADTKIGRPYKGQTDITAGGTFDAPQTPAEPAASASGPAPTPTPPAPATTPPATTPPATTTALATPPSAPAPVPAAPVPVAAPPPTTPAPVQPTPGPTESPATTTDLAPTEAQPAAQHDDGVECQKLVDKSMTNNTIAFPSGSSEVRSVAHEMLNHLAQLAAKCPLKIRITGHIDTSPAEAADPNLSQARADAVATYLTGKGVARKRIKSVGAGADQPVGDNATPAGQAKNRRIEITVTN